MLITLHNSATKKQITSIVNLIHQTGTNHRIINNGKYKSILLINSNKSLLKQLTNMDGVERISPISHPFKLASRQVQSENTIIDIDGIQIGGNNFTLIAGPCSVESERQIFTIANFLIEQGVRFMRGGAYKPRTSPYSFQGLGEEGLKLLGNVRKETGLKIVTEAMDIVTIDEVANYVDIIQIGSRSMQNFPLLKKAGKINKPILLKRGFSATVEELLLSAEYILSEGNENVILCERGIRTFDNHSRNMLDLASIPVIKELSHLPIIVDPSHASGDRNMVDPLSRAAIAVGSHGLLIEVHPDPEKALSDGRQSLSFNGFIGLKKNLQKLEKALNKNIGILDG